MHDRSHERGSMKADVKGNREHAVLPEHVLKRDCMSRYRGLLRRVGVIAFALSL